MEADCDEADANLDELRGWTERVGMSESQNPSPAERRASADGDDSDAVETTDVSGEATPTASDDPNDGDKARRFAEAHGESVSLGVPSLVWGPGQARRVRLIEERIPLAGRRILDVGCGVGQYVRHLRELPATVYGIDIERRRVAEGARHVPGLLVGSADALPFADESFDVVVLNEVIEHVGDERATLREAARILPAGGHVVIYAPNRGFPFETHGVYWRGRYHFGNYPLVNYLPRRLRDRLVPQARVYSGGDLRRLLRGLPYRTVQRGVVYPGFDGIRARNETIGRLLQSALHRAEQTPLRAFGLSHFLILERVVGEAEA